MSPVDLICFKCRHFDAIGGGCKAFDEIPQAITSGVNKHETPLIGQKNNIVFTAI